MKEIDAYDDSEELGGPEPSGRNWKGIGIALLVIAVICAIVILAIVLVAPCKSRSSDGVFSDFLVKFTCTYKNHPAANEEYSRDGVPLTLLDVTDGSLNPSFKDVQWLSGRELLYQSDTNQSIILYDLEKKNKTILVDARIIDKIDTYAVSPSRRYLLYSQNTEKVYRHTNKANFKLLNLREHYSLKDSWDLQLPGVELPAKFQYVKWAPTDDKLVIVYQNDIYYKKTPESNNVVRITNTGSTDEKPEVVYNGVPDWLYEEEILSSDNAVWWSPDNKYLAFLTFNDTNVKTFSFDTYGSDSLTNQYSNATKIRYPKAGGVNPTVQLYIVDPEEAAHAKVIPGDRALVRPPKDFPFKEYYITTVTWLAAEALFVRWTNRYQNESQITTCSPKTLQCTVVVSLKVSNGWLEDAPPFPISNGQRFHMLSSDFIRRNDRHYQTVCTYDAGTKDLKNPALCLDHKFDITEIIAADPNNYETVYAMAAYPLPRNRHLLKLEGTSTPICLTCNSTKCNYFEDVKFSSKDTLEYLTLTCRGPNVPYSEVWKLSDLPMQPDKEATEVLKSNENIQANLDHKALPHRKYYEVSLSSLPNGPSAQVELLIPPKLAEFAKFRYPLLIKVYGGPSTQEVHSRYRMDFEEMLASSYDVVVARIDGRGSSMQGFDMKYHVYKDLGHLEVVDQLEVAKYILDNHPYIDPSRVGIWGWSYGGYATARTILLDNDPQIIRCAASVAPVTDWRFYDTAYTERFMSTPQDNPKAYESSNLMTPYSARDVRFHFSRTSFLLVHGTADDNVHFQQTAQFTKALMKAGVLFKTQIYPDEDHSIRKLRLHLYQTLLEHFTTCFGNGAAVEKADE